MQQVNGQCHTLPSFSGVNPLFEVEMYIGSEQSEKDENCVYHWSSQ